MPRLDGTGPEGDGSHKGRKLGQCKEASSEDKLEKLGKGTGARRKSGGGEGKGKRLKSGKP
jgi:hypothetical protein